MKKFRIFRQVALMPAEIIMYKFFNMCKFYMIYNIKCIIRVILTL